MHAQSRLAADEAVDHCREHLELQVGERRSRTCVEVLVQLESRASDRKVRQQNLCDARNHTPVLAFELLEHLELWPLSFALLGYSSDTSHDSTSFESIRNFCQLPIAQKTLRWVPFALSKLYHLGPIPSKMGP